MDFSQSAEELLTKLDTYREQLAQVEEALEQQPDEPSLVKLKNDLTEVIVLTEDLVKYQAAAPTEAEQAGAETAGTTGRASVVPQPVTSRSAAKSVHTALIGRTCEAFFEQKWYNGEIKSVRRDERGQERAMVEFIGFSNQREFKVTDLRLLRPPHPAQCQPGTRCQAIFPEDGLWYDCVITEQTEKGYKITFIDYGSKAEVRFDQIRLQSSGKVGTAKRTIKEVTTPAGYKIPESMQIQKTDTEDIIDAKRRKITAIKKQQRTDKLETEHVKQQTAWQKFFYKKASARSKCGFMSGKPKDSIFKVPDALEGRVGFMNSGQEMTKFNEARKHLGRDLAMCVAPSLPVKTWSSAALRPGHHHTARAAEGHSCHGEDRQQGVVQGPAGRLWHAPDGAATHRPGRLEPGGSHPGLPALPGPLRVHLGPAPVHRRVPVLPRHHLCGCGLPGASAQEGKAGWQYDLCRGHCDFESIFHFQSLAALQHL
ncbi:unnamed protein product [Effrenium voratum]|nr:unnamed protein product [Effrenium voratum]